MLVTLLWDEEHREEPEVGWSVGSNAMLDVIVVIVADVVTVGVKPPGDSWIVGSG